MEDVAPRVDQHLADILESITDAFISVDSQWQFTYLNQQAEALLGTTREVLLGSNMWEIFPAQPDSVFYLNFHQALDQQSSLTYMAFYPSFNKWFTVRLFPSQQGLSAIFQDITDRKQAEEQLQFYAHLAQSISDAVISTDLQYPLQLHLFGESLPEGAFGEKLFSL
jgi:PAS domain S-box-containing protein